jgi:hypothetical protein
MFHAAALINAFKNEIKEVIEIHACSKPAKEARYA